MARKLLILARETGLELGFPMWKWKACYRRASPEGKSADEFMAMLPQLDAEFKARVEAAKAEGKGYCAT